jgi:crotonobetainyl-CoA:carnitine CoA-transferase CaiB-like acyl-CoA transferase
MICERTEEVPASDGCPEESRKEVTMGGVLDGVRVLDFGRYIAGPLCGALLGDMGADVIRVERVAGGDDRYQYPVTDAGEGACFLQMNRNKRGMTLDPMRPEGRDILARLAEQADVVIANLPADTLARMGLDYASLSAIKPDIILTAISAFGDEGPYGNRVGFDGIGQVMCGATFLSGFERPTKSYASWVDVSTALFSTIGTLAALQEKAKSGRGQQVSTTLFGSALGVFNFNLIEQALTRPNRVRSGNRAQSSGPSDIVQTKDGWIMLQTVGFPLFKRWAALLGEPHWLDDPRFATDALRAENGAVLSERTSLWSCQHTTEAALAILAEARIPAGPVYSPQDVLNDPHVQATGMMTPVDYPGVPAPVPLMMKAIALSETPLTLRMRPPQLGEHTDQIMAKLGYDPVEVQSYRNAGVI